MKKEIPKKYKNMFHTTGITTQKLFKVTLK